MYSAKRGKHARISSSITLFAILATVVLLWIQHYVIKRTDSTAIRADALHYTTDLATNSATVLALLLAQFGWSGLDPLFALGIAAYILYSAYHIAWEAVQLLLDRELSAQEREEIESIAQSTPRVLGLHGLRTRQSGQTKVIQLHLELDDNLPLSDAHRISLAVDEGLRARFPAADITIHQNPKGLGDETKA